jgi:tetratricopeptide (TPR) repeat protein
MRCSFAVPSALLVFVIGLWGGLPAARAQDDVAAAKVHFQKGTRLYEVGDYRQALDEFKSAHLAKPDPAFLYNIAQCHRQLGEYEAAVTLYKRFLAASPNAANRPEVERRIVDLEAALATQKHNAQSPANGPPAGAASPGVGAGYGPSAGTSSAERLGAAFAEDAGTHSASAGTTEPAPAGSSLRTLRWVGAGLTLALAGGAIVAGLSASSRFNELKDSCGATSSGCTGNQIDSVKSRALLTNVLWGAAGVAAVGTGIAFYLTPQASGVQVAWSY